MPATKSPTTPSTPFPKAAEKKPEFNPQEFVAGVPVPQCDNCRSSDHTILEVHPPKGKEPAFVDVQCRTCGLVWEQE